MLARQLHDPPDGVGRAGLRKRYRLFLTVIAVVLVLSAVKVAIHRLRLEFLGLNPLFTSAIAGAIFIIGFLLSSVPSDCKEAERMPTDIRVALTEGSPESALIFGFIAYMFVYALYLISTLEQPFRKGHESMDDVSLFLPREFEEKLRTTSSI